MHCCGTISYVCAKCEKKLLNSFWLSSANGARWMVDGAHRVMSFVDFQTKGLKDVHYRFRITMSYKNWGIYKTNLFVVAGTTLTVDSAIFNIRNMLVDKLSVSNFWWWRAVLLRWTRPRVIEEDNTMSAHSHGRYWNIESHHFWP